MRLELIPVRGGEEVIRAMIRMPGLYGHAQRTLEVDRRFQVIAVHQPLGPPFVPAVDRITVALVGKGAFFVEPAAAITPGAEIVVLGAGADDRRHLRAVDVHHVVALAPPVGLILLDALRHTHEVPASLSFENHIVAGAVQVDLVVDLGRIAIGLPVFRVSLVRHCLPVLRVKARDGVVDARVLLVADVVIEGEHRLRAFIGHRDLRVLPEWHRTIAVQCHHVADRERAASYSTYSPRFRPKKSPMGASTLGVASPSQYIRSTSFLRWYFSCEAMVTQM